MVKLIWSSYTSTLETPRRQAPWRMLFVVRGGIETQVDKMYAGVIRKSHSPGASPVILVWKRNGDYRSCVDTFLLPWIDHLFDQLAHSKFFSFLDLAAGYRQIQVALDSRSKTAFVTHCGLYEFQVMPFWVNECPMEGLNPRKV